MHYLSVVNPKNAKATRIELPWDLAFADKIIE
jgi:hypothetical protein